MLNDNNALVQAIAGFVALLTPAQKRAALAMAEIVTLALSDAPPPVPVASFTHTLDGLNATFTDTSTGGHSRVWSFGDGLTSTAQHPTHVYTTAGTYCVTLTIANEEGEMSAATLLLTVLGGGLGATFDDVVTALAPTIWLKLTEASGTLDNAGSGGAANDGTGTGITYAQSGLRGASEAVLFDNIADFITIPAIDASAFTCVVIYKPGASLYVANIFGDENGFEGDAVSVSLLHTEVGELSGFADNGAAMVSSNAGCIQPNKWNMVALVGTSGQALKLYHSANGALSNVSVSTTGTFTGPITAASAITFKSEIMATLSATSLACDDIMLFESALSEAQLQSIATASGLGIQS